MFRHKQSVMRIHLDETKTTLNVMSKNFKEIILNIVLDIKAVITT